MINSDSYILQMILRNQICYMMSMSWIMLVLLQLLYHQLAKLLILVNQTNGAYRQKPLNRR